LIPTVVTARGESTNNRHAENLEISV